MSVRLQDTLTDFQAEFLAEFSTGYTAIEDHKKVPARVGRTKKRIELEVVEVQPQNNPQLDYALGVKGEMSVLVHLNMLIYQPKTDYTAMLAEAEGILAWLKYKAIDRQGGLPVSDYPSVRMVELDKAEHGYLAVAEYNFVLPRIAYTADAYSDATRTPYTADYIFINNEQVAP